MGMSVNASPLPCGGARLGFALDLLDDFGVELAHLGQGSLILSPLQGTKGTVQECFVTWALVEGCALLTLWVSREQMGTLNAGSCCTQQPSG